MAIFGPKPWVNFFGKMSIFRLFELLFYTAQKGDILLQNVLKTFSWLISPPQKKNGKMAIFGPKPWVNPSGKMSIFQLFELVVFIAQKGVFLLQNFVKDIFLAHIALKKKKLEKWPFLDQNHGLKPFGKMSIFSLFGLFLFIAQKGVFSLQNIVKDFFLFNIA